MLKKTLLTALVALALIAVPIFAFAGDDVVNGTITGLSCYTAKALCPGDKNDPHVALEHTFVLGVDANNYYLLTNLGRNTLAPMVSQKVRVTGKINIKYKAMFADKIEVKEGGKWVATWSEELEQAARKAIMMGAH